MLAAFQFSAGVLHVLFSIFLPPLYLRLLYIFLTRPQYRKMECYRIMTIIGFVQLLAAPGTLFGGLSHLLADDLWNVTVTSVKLFSMGKVGTLKNFHKEKSILKYAGIRFLCDMFLVITFNYIKIPPLDWMGFAISSLYMVNHLLLPTSLYLALNRSIRQEFFLFRSNEVKVVSVTTSSTMNTIG
ncbi:hypothetical protein QR680_016442 [Steinernema hermaphroditum]|uniref:Uncharacterized protein n=1 Tax=Steinernema hermaphroditum TaxID=289476 RepID=A0AA39LMN6_9BILA|nr:hypothetical protein QR680_016442 [Steinernema hermaphroditum]